MDTIQYMIEELCLSGAVGAGKCSKSTLYRYVRQINERLERERYDWRVEAKVEDMAIIVV